MCGPDLSTKPVASCRIGPPRFAFPFGGLGRTERKRMDQLSHSAVSWPVRVQPLHEVRAITRCTSRSELSSALHANLMDRIEALEQRLAELEQRLADVAGRQAEYSAAEWHRHRQCRLEILQSPITSGLKLLPPVHSAPTSREP